MEVPKAGGPPFVIPELLQRFKDFLFGVPGGPNATGDGGMSTTTSLAYIEAVLVVRNELWNDKGMYPGLAVHQSTGSISVQRHNHHHYRGTAGATS